MTNSYPPREGRIFGRLTIQAVHELSSNKDGNHYYTCRCVCGTQTVKRWKNMYEGRTKSCGCIGAEKTSEVAERRASKEQAENEKRQSPKDRDHPLYYTYHGMIGRCYRTSSSSYNRYGAKGITVCERWVNSFRDFVADMGARPDGTTLDRIDGAKGYGPDNCRWATKLEQLNNRVGRNSVYVATIQGTTKPVTEWAVQHNLNPDKIKADIKKGADPAVAVVAAKFRKKVSAAGGKLHPSVWERCRAKAVEWVAKNP